MSDRRAEDDDDSYAALRQPRKLIFSPTITVGNIITIFVVAVGGISVIANMNAEIRDVAGQVATEQALRQKDEGQIDRIDRAQRDDMVRIETLLRRIEDKLDGKADKAQRGP